MFARRGAGATLNDVAREAGVGVGTVYRKFADKDALLDALFDAKIASLVALTRAADVIDDPGVAVRGFLFGLMEARATDRALDAILMAPGRNLRFADALAEEFIPAVDRLVERAVAAGELRADLSAQEICLLAYMVGSVADVTREADPDVWRRYAQLLIDGTAATAATAQLSPPPLSFADAAAALGRAR